MTTTQEDPARQDAGSGHAAPGGVPTTVTVAAVVAVGLAALLVAAAIALALDLNIARDFHDAAKLRSSGGIKGHSGVGDLIVAVVLNLIGAGVLAVGGWRLAQGAKRPGRVLLLLGAQVTIGTAVFWILMLQTASLVVWAVVFTALALAVLGLILNRVATEWFGVKATAPARRAVVVRTRWNSLSRQAQWTWSLLAIAVLVVLPFISSDFPLLGLINTEPATDFPITLFNAARYALIAIGLNVVVGQAGLLDLGYVGFFPIRAYVVPLFTSSDSTVRVFTDPHSQWAWLICVPIAMCITMLSGLILGAPTLRLRGDYLAIVTLGFGEIVRLLADNVTPLKGNIGFQNIARPPGHRANGTPIFTQTDGKPWYWLTIALIVVVLILVGNLERSRAGRAWVAIREDEDAAEIMGVPTFKFKLWAFVIGASIGGLSGALYAGQIGFVNNQRFDPVTSILFLAAVVLGGAGNKVGVIIGAFIISYLPNRFTSIAKYDYLIFGIALISLMLFRPQGILGARQRLLTYGRDAYRRVSGGPERLDTGKGAFSTEVTSGAMGAGMVTEP
jgi:branched-chain amino acid transport system permease protein